MIKLQILNYGENVKIDNEITRYVNDNIASIIRVIKDYIEDDCGFSVEEFLPREYLKSKPDECENLIYELDEIIRSENIRDFIKPKYEYLLYHILIWWLESSDETEKLILNEISDSLKEKIVGCSSYSDDDNGGKFILKYITTFEEYLDILFDDLDFLSGNLENMVTLYLKNPMNFEVFFSDVELDNYYELMPHDLKELYTEKREQYKLLNDIEKISKSKKNLEENIVMIFNNAIHNLEKRVVEIENRSENEISNDIYSIVEDILKFKFNLECIREMTIGRANKQMGETDLYVYKNTNDEKSDILIVENKIIENFREQYQQLLGYLNQNFKFGITISINRNMNRSDAINKIKKKLEIIKEDDKDFKIIKIFNPFPDNMNIIASTHVIPEDEEKEMTIYHMILNLYDRERKEIAKKARHKL